MHAHYLATRATVHLVVSLPLRQHNALGCLEQLREFLRALPEALFLFRARGDCTAEGVAVTQGDFRPCSGL